MPRHFVTVPDSDDDDVIEEVNYLRKTKQGSKAVKKQTPKTHPPQTKAKDTSHSRSKGKRRAQVRNDEDGPQDVDNVGDMDTYQVLEGYEDDIAYPIADETQPQVMVRSCMFSCNGIANYIFA
jgi:hypothetical protein